MLEPLRNIFSSIDPSAIVTLFLKSTITNTIKTLIDTIIIKILYLFSRRRMIKNILEFTDNPYTYTVPIFSADIWSGRGENKNVPVIVYEESIIPIKISHFMSYIKHDFEIELCKLTNKMYSVDTDLNRFACGGPFTNPDTCQLLKQRKLQVRFPCAKEVFNKEIKEGNSCIQDFAFPVDSVKQRKQKVIYGIEENFFEFDSRDQAVIFWVRLKGSTDFGDKKHGTVHILAGTSTLSTVKAVEILFKNPEAIYRIAKKYKRNHCAFLFRMSKNGEIDFVNHADITNDLFKDAS